MKMTGKFNSMNLTKFEGYIKALKAIDQTETDHTPEQHTSILFNSRSRFAALQQIKEDHMSPASSQHLLFKPRDVRRASSQ